MLALVTGARSTAAIWGVCCAVSRAPPLPPKCNEGSSSKARRAACAVDGSAAHRRCCRCRHRARRGRVTRVACSCSGWLVTLLGRQGHGVPRGRGAGVGGARPQHDRDHVRRYVDTRPYRRICARRGHSRPNKHRNAQAAALLSRHLQYTSSAAIVRQCPQAGLQLPGSLSQKAFSGRHSSCVRAACAFVPSLSSRLRRAQMNGAQAPASDDRPPS